jgi:site-specific DNA-cytosine methylase
MKHERNETKPNAGELYAGTATMSQALQEQGYCIKVLCELENNLQELAKVKFKEANVQPDMNERPWRAWAAAGITLAILIAGFACQPFSTAGMMREQHDSRAFQVLQVLEAAKALKATMVLLENVDGLVDNDWRHGVYSMIKIKFKAAGYKTHILIRAKHDECGGDTGRARVFLLFDTNERETAEEEIRLQTEPWQEKEWPEHIPEHDQGAKPWGHIKRAAGNYTERPVGSITLREGLGEVGQAVTVRELPGTWRVMSKISTMEGVELRNLMSTDRRQPTKRTVNVDQVEAVDERGSTFPVYRTCGKLPTITASGEPPRSGAGLVVNKEGEVYTMGTQARAHVQGLDRDDFQMLQELGCSTTQLRRVVGGMIPLKMARAVIKLVTTEHREQEENKKRQRRENHDCAELATPTVEVAFGWPFMEDGGKVAVVDQPVEREREVVGEEPQMGRQQRKTWPQIRPEVRTAGKTTVALIPVSREGRTVQATKTTLIGISVETHKVTTGKVVKLVQHLLPGHELALAGKYQTEGEEVWVVAAIGLEPATGWKPRSLAQLEDHPTHGPATLAMARVLSFGDQVTRKDVEALLETSQRALGGAKTPAKLGTRSRKRDGPVDQDQLRAAREQATKDAQSVHEQLEQSLLALAERPESNVTIRGESKAEYLREWVPQITDAELYMRVAPPTCLLQPPDFSDGRLADMELLDTAPIPSTERLPPVPEQEPLPEHFNPQSLADLKEPEGAEEYQEEMKRHQSFLSVLQHTKLEGKQLAMHRPKPRAFSELTRVKEARGKVFDLRGPTPKLMEMNAKVECEIDAEYFRKMLPGHADKQIPQFLEEGVRGQAELPMQTVLQSHLLSLANHTEHLGKDIDRRERLKYLQKHKKQPFDPIRLNPQGTRPKKGSIRQISDLGQPRKKTVDEQGVEVEVFNEKVKMDGEGRQKLPHEWKAHPPHILHNMAVLRHIGDLVGLTLCMFSDDLRDFFRQFAIHPSELWMMPFLWASGEEPEFITELRVGFGLAHASNVAQRFANAVIRIFMIEFEKADESYLEEDRRKYPALAEWLKRTGHKMYSCCFYTDDLHGMTLGVDRTARAIGVWFEVTRKLNVLCSVPRKRMAGVAITWTGLDWYSTLGGAALTEEKEVDAQRTLTQASTGTLEVSAYRSIVGLLEWARFALGIESSSMYQMYGPMQKGGELSQGPTTWVRATEPRKAQWRKWSNLLAQMCFASAEMVLGGRPTPPPTGRVHAWHGDAAIKGTNFPGLCGFWKGLYWIFELTPRHLKYLHISALELITVLANFMIFGPLLRLQDQEALEQLTILIQSDSLVSTSILTGRPSGVGLAPNGAAKSPLMQHIHQVFQESPDFLRLHDCVVVGHEWGEGNILSDAGSRGREDKLLAMCQSMGIKAKRLTIPTELTHLLERAVRFAIENPSPNDKHREGKSSQ